jgi:HD superfamily phosphohydrolase
LPKDFRTHEDCTLALLREGQVGEQIKKIGCDLEQVVDLLTGAHWNDGLCKLLSGTIDVDRWDYLMRDAAAAGVVYGNYDLDWMIHSLNLHEDAERRPRLLVEAHRGLVAVEHFLGARRTMYQQVYYHPTVRGAERLLRAIFERAKDPARPDVYKENAEDGIPECLHGVLRGEGPSLTEFVDIDDTVIMGAIKQWSRSATDPVLRYLAMCMVERRLFKEIRFETPDFEAVLKIARSAVREALARQTASDLPSVDPNDEHAWDYFVLVDRCEFKIQNRFDGILFETGGGAGPQTFDEIQLKPEHNIMSGQQAFTRTKIFVPSDLAGGVRTALRERRARE